MKKERRKKSLEGRGKGEERRGEEKEAGSGKEEMEERLKRQERES